MQTNTESRRGARPIELMLLTVPTCPHGHLLEQRLTDALDGRDAVIVRREITNAEEAGQYGLRGSPTLLINGIDPFADPDRWTSFACRFYRQPDGRLEGAPTLEQLRTALDERVADYRAGTECTGASGCMTRSLWGWSPPPSPANTRLKQVVDRWFPRTGWPLVGFYAVVIALLNLAAHLPVRGALVLDALAAAAAGAWCAVNFWRCHHAHCVVTSTGWLALALFAAVEAGLGRSLIGGYEQVAFLVILALGVGFEAMWYSIRRTNAI